MGTAIAEVIALTIIVCFVLWLFGFEGLIAWFFKLAIIFGFLYLIGCIIGLGFKAVTGV